MPSLVAALAVPFVLAWTQSYLSAHLDGDTALVAGDAGAARAGFARCLELSPGNSTVAYGLACAAALAGDRVRALEELERAAAWGYPDAELALWDVDLASLRSEPRFTAALLRMRRNAGVNGGRSRLVALHDLFATSHPRDASVDPCGNFVAVAESDGTIRILDAHSGSELRRSPALASPASEVGFHPDGQRIAALCADGRVRLWNARGDGQPKEIDALLAGASERVHGTFLEYDPIGARLLVGGNERASLWTAEGELVRRWADLVPDAPVAPVAWSPDGAQIAIAMEAGVQLLDGASGAELGPPLDCASPALALHFRRDGGRLATGHEDLHVRVWDPATREFLFARPREERVFLESGIGTVRFSNRGAELATATDASVVVVVLDATTGELLWKSDFLGEGPGELLWSADDRFLWFSHGGRGELFELEREHSSDAHLIARGRLQHDGGAIATLTSASGVAALDTATGRFLWHRPARALGSGELLMAAQGSFTLSGESEDLAGLELVDPARASNGGGIVPVALYRRLELLLDPKRVRAARAGVALAPVEL